MKVITIGRNPDNDIVINDVKVSRNHLQIVQDDNGNCSAVDLSSANGTLVNGQRIAGETRLLPNDTVQIGDTRLPWQSYITPQQPQQQIIIDPPKPPKSKLKIWLIITGIVIALLAGGTILYFNTKVSESKKGLQRLENLDKKKDAEKQKALDKEEFDKLFKTLSEDLSNPKFEFYSDDSNFLEMKQIAKNYSDDPYFQDIIKELTNKIKK